MPRFGTRTLLIVFALFAVWMSTFSGFSAAQDVRRSMLLLVLVAALSLAICTGGRRRAFWSGFVAVMILCGGLNLEQPLSRYVPSFVWQQTMGINLPQYAPQAYGAAYYSPPPTPVPVPATSYQPTVIYSAPTAAYPAPYPAYQGMAFSHPAIWLGMVDTLTAAWTLGLSAISGFLAAYIFSRSQRSVVEPSPSARQIVEQELQK